MVRSAFRMQILLVTFAMLSSSGTANAVTITFDGFTAGPLNPGAPTISSYLEGGFAFQQAPFQVNTSDPAFVDVGGGDIGLRDSPDPGHLGVFISFTRPDAVLFTFDSVAGINTLGLTPTVVGLKVDGFLGGSFVAGDSFSPSTTTPTTFTAVNLAGHPLDEVRISFIVFGSDDVVLTEAAFTPLPVPEPSVMFLLASGLLCLGWRRADSCRRRLSS